PKEQRQRLHEASVQASPKRATAHESPSLLPQQGTPYGTQPLDVPCVEDDCDTRVEEASGQPPTVADLMRWLREQPGTWVSCYVRMITKSGDQALVLAQILYWFDNGKKGTPRSTLRRNGKVWMAKTHQQLGEEVGLKSRQVKTCLSTLKTAGLIEVEHHLF